MGILVVLALLLLVCFWLCWRRPASERETLARQRGRTGEAMVGRILQASCRERTGYVLSNVTLPWQDGTTQIDHLLINRYGIFVVEVKHRSGEIVAPPDSPVWTQVTSKGRYAFQNPLYQNQTHVAAVRALFGRTIPVCGWVVLTGSARLQPPWPVGVYSAQGLRDALEQTRPIALTPTTMLACVARLEAVRLAPTLRTERQHIAYVKRVQRRSSSWH